MDMLPSSNELIPIEVAVGKFGQNKEWDQSC